MKVLWSENFWFLWKHSYGMWCFAGADLWKNILLKQTQVRGCVIFRKEYKYDSTDSGGRLWYWFSWLRLASLKCSPIGSPCLVLLIFTCDFVDSNSPRTFHDILVASCCFHRHRPTGGASRFLLDRTATADSWVVIAEWTRLHSCWCFASGLDSWQWRLK